MDFFKKYREKVRQDIETGLMADPVFRLAYDQAARHKEKQEAFERLEATKLNYAIIQDLVNSAQAGIEIEVHFISGEVMKIKPTGDAFDQSQRARFGKYF